MEIKKQQIKKTVMADTVKVNAEKKKEKNKTDSLEKRTPG